MHGSLKTFRGSEPVHNQRKERESKRERVKERDVNFCGLKTFVSKLFIITKRQKFY